MVSNQVPRLARPAPQKVRCFRIVNDLFLRRIPTDFMDGAISDVSQMRNNGRAMPNLHIRRRLIPRADALDEIFHVQRDGVLGGYFLALHAEYFGRFAAPDGARTGGNPEFGINLEAEPVCD